MKLPELRKKIEEANQAYRTGEPIISDTEYDALIEELERLTDGKDPLLDKVGFEVDQDERKEELPLPMYSMNKVKSGAEIQKWGELKDIPGDTVMVITPKYDGLSLCAHDSAGDAWTRGNGIVGQRSNLHYKELMKNKKKITTKVDGFSFGELIMKKSVFAEKYAETFKNSRNMGAGMVNAKEVRDTLQDFDYLRFGFASVDGVEGNKIGQLEFLNKELNTEPVPFKTATLAELEDDLLHAAFAEFNHDYEMDGLIVEVADENLRAELGREKNGNPVYARAWKGIAEEAKVSNIKAVDYQVSKHGLLKPVARIEPVELDGVTVSNVTLINAKFIKDSKLGPGADVTVIRSGQVIPKIVGVVTSAKKYTLPKKCPSCGTKVEWNENEVELVCPNHDACPEQLINRMIAFFEILGVENLAEGVIRQFYENGFNTVAKVLAMSQADMLELEKFAERKAEVIYTGIHEKLKDVGLEKLRHASGVFVGLGTKKLALLNHFDDPKKVPGLEEVVAVEGFSEKTAQVFIDAYKNFWDFIKDLPVSIKKETGPATTGLSEYAVCFSGVRRKDLEEVITNNGGKVASGVSKKTTHLVMKATGTGSSKEKKAADLNIPILVEAEFEKLIAGYL